MKANYFFLLVLFFLSVTFHLSSEKKLDVPYEPAHLLKKRKQDTNGNKFKVLREVHGILVKDIAEPQIVINSPDGDFLIFPVFVLQRMEIDN